MTDYQSPVLYHRGRKGVIYQWRVWTDGATILTEYGQAAGQLQQTPGKVAEAKNVGRSNATTPEQQAVIEAQAMYAFKIERKYCATVEECQQRKLLPMLAPGKPFAETKKYVKYPCDAQPKLDGCRCLAYWDGDAIVLASRSGKPWNLPHIVEQLKKILPEDAMFDGELYVHGETFQEITRRIKSKDTAVRSTVEYHVYDVPVCGSEEGKPWHERYSDLLDLVGITPEIPSDLAPNVFRVPTRVVECEEEVYALQVLALQQGFEGAMVRLHDGLYEWGYRSKSLLKVKTFDDHEFRVVGFKNGRGKNESIVTWVCDVGDGRTFDVSPVGKRDLREQMLRDGESHIGQFLKVKHFGWTDEGKPRMPTGMGFRLEEDTPVAA